MDRRGGSSRDPFKQGEQNNSSPEEEEELLGAVGGAPAAPSHRGGYHRPPEEEEEEELLGAVGGAPVVAPLDSRFYRFQEEETGVLRWAPEVSSYRGLFRPQHAPQGVDEEILEGFLHPRLEECSRYERTLRERLRKKYKKVCDQLKQQQTFESKEEEKAFLKNWKLDQRRNYIGKQKGKQEELFLERHNLLELETQLSEYRRNRRELSQWKSDYTEELHRSLVRGAEEHRRKRREEEDQRQREVEERQDLLLRYTYRGMFGELEQCVPPAPQRQRTERTEQLARRQQHQNDPYLQMLTKVQQKELECQKHIEKRVKQEEEEHLLEVSIQDEKTKEQLREQHKRCVRNVPGPLLIKGDQRSLKYESIGKENTILRMKHANISSIIGELVLYLSSMQGLSLTNIGYRYRAERDFLLSQWNLSSQSEAFEVFLREYGVEWISVFLRIHNVPEEEQVAFIQRVRQQETHERQCREYLKQLQEDRDALTARKRLIEEERMAHPNTMSYIEEKLLEVFEYSFSDDEDDVGAAAVDVEADAAAGAGAAVGVDTDAVAGAAAETDDDTDADSSRSCERGAAVLEQGGAERQAASVASGSVFVQEAVSHASDTSTSDTEDLAAAMEQLFFLSDTEEALSPVRSSTDSSERGSSSEDESVAEASRSETSSSFSSSDNDDTSDSDDDDEHYEADVSDQTTSESEASQEEETPRQEAAPSSAQGAVGGQAETGQERQQQQQQQPEAGAQGPLVGAHGISPDVGGAGGPTLFIPGYNLEGHTSSLQGLQTALLGASEQVAATLQALALHAQGTLKSKASPLQMKQTRSAKLFSRPKDTAKASFATDTRIQAFSPYQIVAFTDTYTTNLEQKVRSGRAGIIVTPTEGWSIGFAYDRTKESPKEHHGMSFSTGKGSVKATTEIDGLAAVIAWNTNNAGCTGHLVGSHGWGTVKNTRSFTHGNEHVGGKGRPDVRVSGGLVQIGYTLPVSASLHCTPYMACMVSVVKWNPYNESSGPLPCAISRNTERVVEHSIGVRTKWALSDTSQLQGWIAGVSGCRKIESLTVRPLVAPIELYEASVPRQRKQYTKGEIGVAYTAKLTDALALGVQGTMTLEEKGKRHGKQHIAVQLRYTY